MGLQHIPPVHLVIVDRGVHHKGHIHLVLIRLDIGYNRLPNDGNTQMKVHLDLEMWVFAQQNRGNSLHLYKRVNTLQLLD